MKLLLYCTKSKNKYDRLVRDEHYGNPFYLYGAITENFESLNGKIVAECDFEVERIDYRSAELLFNRHYLEVLDKSCLTDKEMYDYLKGENGYAIHIKNLHIFDEPIKLEKCHNDDFSSVVNYAPQNMMYSWLFTDKWNRYALISIQPQWLYKILNGEKTIEIRKKILKGMMG